MKKILLVEDNKDHCILIQKTLQKGLKQVQITHVDRIEKALDELQNKAYDLILSDFYLPDGQGTQYIQKVAKLAPDIPLVIITGQGDEKIAARSIQAGADDYIVKTRDALQALPKILNRTWAKHQSQQTKKKQALKRELEVQEEILKKVLSEVETLEKKIDSLNRSTKDTRSHAMEALVTQVDQLKKFVQKFFFSGK